MLALWTYPNINELSQLLATNTHPDTLNRYRIQAEAHVCKEWQGMAAKNNKRKRVVVVVPCVLACAFADIQSITCSRRDQFPFAPGLHVVECNVARQNNY